MRKWTVDHAQRQSQPRKKSYFLQKLVIQIAPFRPGD